MGDWCVMAAARGMQSEHTSATMVKGQFSTHRRRASERNGGRVSQWIWIPIQSNRVRKKGGEKQRKKGLEATSKLRSSER